MVRLDWRAAAWIAGGLAFAALFIAGSYSDAKSAEAEQHTVQVCIEKGGHPQYNKWNNFSGCE